MGDRVAREYGAAVVGSVVGTFLLAAIGFGIVRIGLGWLASWLALGLEVVLPGALFVGLCSWVGAVWGCWFGLKRVNAPLIGQTVYIQAGLLVLCYAALIAIRVRHEQANLFVAWAFLIALSVLLSRGMVLWIDARQVSSLGDRSSHRSR